MSQASSTSEPNGNQTLFW